MTPKEKAIELIDKFENETYSLIQGQLSKQCALIAVDEIMTLLNSSIEHFVPHFGGGGHTIKMPNQEYQYWQEVKQEIENL